MATSNDIDAFLRRLADHDGFAPFSDGKLPIEPGSDRVLVVSEDDRVVALAASADHVQHDGSSHRELETAVEPGMRFAAFEGAVVDMALPGVEEAGSSSVWSQRSSLDEALTVRGFAPRRHLDYMEMSLPLTRGEAGPAIAIRTYTTEDLDAIVSVNRAAFGDHREAAALDAAAMARYEKEPWFDPRGLLIVEDRGVVGFCWTRVHDNGDGEIFRIAVDPERQGTGLGRALLYAGFAYLSQQPAVQRGTLWVDRSATAAVSLYRSIGLVVERTNTEFARR